jgi:hypothetical protein
MSHQGDGARELRARTFGEPERVGAAVSQIFELARVEAEQLRLDAHLEADAILAESRDSAFRLREGADAYAEAKRAAVGREVAKMLVDSNLAADAVLADAEVAATAQLKQAQQACDQLRADALFELERLAARREQVERIVEERSLLAKDRADEARAHARQLQVLQDALAASAFSPGELDASAARQAELLLADAGVQAEVVRAQARRELREAQQRRDSIHQHLAELARMLRVAAAVPEPRDITSPSVRARARRARSGAPHHYNWAIAGARRISPNETVVEDC